MPPLHNGHLCCSSGSKRGAPRRHLMSTLISALDKRSPNCVEGHTSSQAPDEWLWRHTRRARSLAAELASNCWNWYLYMSWDHSLCSLHFIISGVRAGWLTRSTYRTQPSKKRQIYVVEALSNPLASTKSRLGCQSKPSHGGYRLSFRRHRVEAMSSQLLIPNW